MANKIEVTTLNPANRFVTALSRYANSKVLYYGDQHLTTFSTYKKNNIPLDANDKFSVVTPSTEFRPDMVSQQAYGVPDFWWKIMEVNNIKDVYDFKVGVNIRLPANIY